VSALILNKTYRINQSFSSWDEATSTSLIEDPTSVTVTEYNTSISPANIILTATAAKDSAGEYHYDYTPATVGIKILVFDTVFSDSSTEDTIYEFEIVADNTEEAVALVFDTLIEDEVIQFASGMVPMFFDPDELIEIFPEAGALEVAEHIHYASLEVLEILKTDSTLTVYEDLPYVAVDYVKASAACALSKIYDAGGDEMSITLGDLSVMNANRGSNKTTRGNASTWCQQASALRAELRNESLLFGGGKGVKAFQKGVSHANPMPDRSILRRGEGRVDTRDRRDNRTLRSLDD